MQKAARWWTPLAEQKVRCDLCPRRCVIKPSQRGFCYIRLNKNGELHSEGWGAATGFALDPIEKKPLNHFHPASSILSFGTAGCNMACKFCQNWTTSKATATHHRYHVLEAAEVVELARQHGADSIAYTYNEPTIFGEYVCEVSREAHKQGLHNVMVSNGYIELSAAKDIYQSIDAANVDLKGFSDAFYQRLTGSHLQPVLDFLVWLRQETDVWIEITTLLISGENDDPTELAEMSRWIAEHLGPHTPLHLTAFHPDYKLSDYPRTRSEQLLKAREIALQNNLQHVYTGNVYHPPSQSTYCAQCGTLLIERGSMSVSRYLLVSGRCPECGSPLAGHF